MKYAPWSGRTASGWFAPRADGISTSAGPSSGADGRTGAAPGDGAGGAGGAGGANARPPAFVQVIRAVPDPTRDHPETDERLLEQLRAGNREVFGPLVRRYERELFGYLRRYLGDDDLADDVFQNTFLQVFLKIAQYEPGRPARPWIYAIATNQAIDALRRRGRRADRGADAAAAPDE